MAWHGVFARAARGTAIIFRNGTHILSSIYGLSELVIVLFSDDSVMVFPVQIPTPE
jgi:hypothetical protein